MLGYKFLKVLEEQEGGKRNVFRGILEECLCRDESCLEPAIFYPTTRMAECQHHSATSPWVCLHKQIYSCLRMLVNVQQFGLI